MGMFRRLGIFRRGCKATAPSSSPVEPFKASPREEPESPLETKGAASASRSPMRAAASGAAGAPGGGAAAAALPYPAPSPKAAAVASPWASAPPPPSSGCPSPPERRPSPSPEGTSGPQPATGASQPRGTLPPLAKAAAPAAPEDAPPKAETPSGTGRTPLRAERQSQNLVPTALGPEPLAADGALEEKTISFDTPLEEVYAGVGEAFGQMIAMSIKSTKWDKRSQAVKAVTSVLKGLDLQGAAPPGSTGVLGKGLRLRDRARCWRLSCLLLHQCMRDKVMPVRLAAFELFMDTFSNTEGSVPQEEAKMALEVLLDHVLDRLGDSNLRLHEAARRCVLFTAERTGLLDLRGVLVRLRLRLETGAGPTSKAGERTKIHFGVLDTVGCLLKHFPGRRGGAGPGPADEADEADDADDADDADAPCAFEDSWTQHDVAPFIVASMDDVLGPRVRGSAIALAVRLYQTFGAEAMTPVLAGLKPAKQALLKQKFQESEEEARDEAFEFEFDEDTDVEVPSSGPGGQVSRAPADVQGLVVCGVGFSMPLAGPQLPGAPPEEEFLMDGILDEAGMVFNGNGIRNDGGAPGATSTPTPSFGAGLGDRAGRPAHPQSANHSLVGISAAQPRHCDSRNEFDNEYLLFEEELMDMGLDFEGIDEQQALLSSLQLSGGSQDESGGGVSPDAVANGVRNALQVEEDERQALLNSMQEDMSNCSLQSVEAF